MRNYKYQTLAASAIALAVAGTATSASAQSTGSVEFENVIVVTGKQAKGVAGVDIPATPKAKQVLDQSFISKSTPGQSINEVINMMPGVSFYNADPYGSSGGAMYIRGFDSSRIAQTFDGMPLNDTGNYALYSNQQLDMELIDQVSVNLGSTDVDSPTAAATGATVNYRSVDPTHELGARAIVSLGEYNYRRAFGVVNTGDLTKSGLRAWLSASTEYNNFLPNTGGHVFKQQVNFKVYQPLGGNGDFISIAGHFNNNRNNFAPSMSLYLENVSARPVNSSSSGRYPTSWADAGYTINCADTTSATKSTTGYGAYECRYNPSRTANLRLNSKFTLGEGLTLTIDPSFQYTKANGGGTAAVSGATTSYGGTAMTGFFYNGTSPYYYTGTGTAIPIVGVASETETNRIGLLASLRYKFGNQSLRLSYSYDRGRHKQTGEVTTLDTTTGYYSTYFPIDNPIVDKDGNPLEKRNRLSYAILLQAAGEYNGKFFDNRLDVLVGVRAPFFKRNLTNFCFTVDASGDYSCMAQQYQATYAAANPYTVTTNATTGAVTVTGAATPQQRIYSYNKLLPNVGFTFKVLPTTSFFANYSLGLQVPGTDTLYNAFWYPTTSTLGAPKPETSQNFDFGLRFSRSKLQASFAGWYTLYHNKISQTYDQTAQKSIYSNLGDVEKYGVDGTVSYKVDKHWSLYAFGSWNKSRIISNVLVGAGTSNLVYQGLTYQVSDGTNLYYATAGKREGAVPVYTAGARIEADFDPVNLTVSVKNNGKRYLNNENLPVWSTSVVAGGAEVAPATLAAYTTVDLTARYKLDFDGLKAKNSYFQLNVQNLFNTFYVGGINNSGGAPISALTIPAAYLGTPRTISGTLSMQF
jgi:iron complex outermembrane receptor protein